MILHKKWHTGCCVAALMLMAFFPATAGAERFADLLMGFSVAQEDPLKFSSGQERGQLELGFESAMAYGYRMGYWFERFPYMALAMEVDYTDVENDNTDVVNVLSFSPLLMFRLQLMKNDKYPLGEWSPFIAAGPGIFLSEIRFDVEDSSIPDIVDLPTVTGEYRNKRTDVGLDLRAGVKKMVAANWAVNLEYRFFHFRPEYEDNILGNTVTTEIDITTHSLMLGVTYNF